LLQKQAAGVAAELLHEDYAYVFEAYWDLWSPSQGGARWVETPTLVRFVAHGAHFEDGAAAETGHIQVDFGLDAPFLHEELALTAEAEEHVRNNVHKLVEFTALVEKNAGATGRLLWSESEENLAQKLIARLQKSQLINHGGQRGFGLKFPVSSAVLILVLPASPCILSLAAA